MKTLLEVLEFVDNYSNTIKLVSSALLMLLEKKLGAKSKSLINQEQKINKQFSIKFDYTKTVSKKTDNE